MLKSRFFLIFFFTGVIYLYKFSNGSAVASKETTLPEAVSVLVVFADEESSTIFRYLTLLIIPSSCTIPIPILVIWPI